MPRKTATGSGAARYLDRRWRGPTARARMDDVLAAGALPPRALPGRDGTAAMAARAARRRHRDEPPGVVDGQGARYQRVRSACSSRPSV